MAAVPTTVCRSAAPPAPPPSPCSHHLPSSAGGATRWAFQVLEVTLISSKDLKRMTLFTKMHVYGMTSISGGDPRLPTHRTHTDCGRGRNLMWHAPLRFTIPPAADPLDSALHVLLHAERAFGEVFLPVRDIATAAPKDGEQLHLSYQACRPVSSRKRGVLHLLRARRRAGGRCSRDYRCTGTGATVRHRWRAPAEGSEPGSASLAARPTPLRRQPPSRHCSLVRVASSTTAAELGTGASLSS